MCQLFLSLLASLNFARSKIVFLLMTKYLVSFSVTVLYCFLSSAVRFREVKISSASLPIHDTIYESVNLDFIVLLRQFRCCIKTLKSTEPSGPLFRF